MPARSTTSGLLLTAASVAIAAAAGKQKTHQVDIIAYSGGLMTVPGWGPVVIALDGLELGGQLAILADHDPQFRGIVGHGQAGIANNKLLVSGLIIALTEAAKSIVGLTRAGFQFQASVGVQPTQYEWVRPEQTIRANGRTITAPTGGLTFIRKGTLREVSIVSVASDSDTSVTVAASQSKKGSKMTFDEWLQAKKFDPTQISDEQKTTLQAAYDGEQQRATPPPLPTPAGEMRADAAAESLRIHTIREICAGQHAELEGKAIAGGWDANETRLQVLRASRGAGPAIHSRQGAPGREVLEAGLLLHLGREDLAEKFGDQVAQQARDSHIHSMIDLCRAAVQLEHVEAGPGTDGLLKAAFSTVSLPGILSNVAGKVMLNAYRAFPSTARKIARKLSAADFKTHTGCRLTGDFTMQEVGPAGELKHAIVSEDSFTFRIATFGRMFTVTRQTVINDDLGALAEVPQIIGRGAAVAVENVFWTLVLANTGSFFSAGNGNYIHGAGFVLDSVGLKAAVAKFLKQTDQDGNPIMVVPKFLVTPPELKVDADELYMSTSVNTGGAATAERIPSTNAFFGLYEPLVAPHLSNSNYTGYSLLAWYLFGDPVDVAAFGIAYLNGRDAPVIERVDLASDVLGMGWRGYLDFGVCQVDKRGAVKSKGGA